MLSSGYPYGRIYNIQHTVAMIPDCICNTAACAAYSHRCGHAVGVAEIDLSREIGIGKRGGPDRRPGRTANLHVRCHVFDLLFFRILGTGHCMCVLYTVCRL